MKLSCQEHLVPGDTFADRLANLAAWGYEGSRADRRRRPPTRP